MGSVAAPTGGAPLRDWGSATALGCAHGDGRAEKCEGSFIPNNSIGTVN